MLNRKQKHKLLLFYKMQNNLSPDYLSSLVPPTIGDTTKLPVTKLLKFTKVHASSQLYYNSFLPSVISEWKELPEDYVIYQA